MMPNQAVLEHIGLPVACLDENCQAKSHVKPGTDYDGWYKSKLLRNYTKKWYCPEHAKEVKKKEDKFLSGGYMGVIMPKEFTQEQETAPADAKTVEDELYELLD